MAYIKDDDGKHKLYIGREVLIPKKHSIDHVEYDKAHDKTSLVRSSRSFEGRRY